MLTGMCERECANRDEFLTRGLQCSAQGFAGASGEKARRFAWISSLEINALIYRNMKRLTSK